MNGIHEVVGSTPISSTIDNAEGVRLEPPHFIVIYVPYIEEPKAHQ